MPSRASARKSPTITMPISRSMAVGTRVPSHFCRWVAENRMTAVAPGQGQGEHQSPIVPALAAQQHHRGHARRAGDHQDGQRDDEGLPAGTSPITPSAVRKIMRRPIRNRTMPPAIETDSGAGASAPARTARPRNSISTPSAISNSRARIRRGGQTAATQQPQEHQDVAQRVQDQEAAGRPKRRSSATSVDLDDPAAGIGRGAGQQFDAGAHSLRRPGLPKSVFAGRRARQAVRIGPGRSR